MRTSGIDGVPGKGRFVIFQLRTSAEEAPPRRNKGWAATCLAAVSGLATILIVDIAPGQPPVVTPNKLPTGSNDTQVSGPTLPGRNEGSRVPVPARLLFVDRHALAFDRVGVLQEAVEEGDLVKAGQVIARLRNEIAAAALAVAEARVENEAEVVVAQKHRESAEAEFRAALRANEVAIARGATAGLIFEASAIDRLRLTSEAAGAEVEKARKEHSVSTRTRDQARAELEAMALSSPRDGLVTRVFKRRGEGVQAAEAVVEVLSTSRIRVEAEITAALAASLQAGDAVEVDVTFPSNGKSVTERFSTTLRFVDPALERVSQTVRVWAELDNSSGRLREGLRTQLLLAPATSTAPVEAPAGKAPPPE